ncbi:hypothetical protein MnTg02_01480 [bacterium MnTg02]|nr:hypothetical protein MnTg02_01480 [bacterium MnTg02]
MSGSRFVLMILCLIGSFTAGAYAVMSWSAFKQTQAKLTSEMPRVTKDPRALARRARKDAAKSPSSESTSKLAGESKPAPLTPEFDVVRVQPNGDAVLAGRSEPGWKVRVESNRGVIGQAKADSSGQWVIIADKPLAPGEHSIKLSALSPDGNAGLVSDQTITVSIAEKPKATPRVALSDNKGQKKVLQKPLKVAEAVAEKKPVPSNEKVARVANSTQSPAKASDKSANSAGSKTADIGSAKPATDSMAKKVPGDGDVRIHVAKTPGEKKADKDAKVARKQASLEKDVPSVIDSVRNFFGVGSSDGKGSEPSKDKPLGDQKSVAAASSPVPVPLVSFGSVGYEKSLGKTGSLSMEGIALPGTRIRLYLDNKHVGSVTAKENGSWTFHKRLPLPAGRYKLRAEQVDQSGKVFARADKPLEWTLPKAAIIARVGEVPGAREVAQPPKPATAPIVKPEPSGGAVTAKPQSGKTLEKPDQKIAALDVKSNSEKSKRAARRRSRVRAKHKKIISRKAKRRNGRRVRTANARISGTRALGRRLRRMRSRGAVIVRRGDTLWDIAEQYYGRGIRYKSIYRKNRRKIRDPHWIYPAQKFKLP